MNKTSFIVFCVAQSALATILFVATNGEAESKPAFNVLCHNDKIDDYDVTWEKIFEAQIALDICRERPEVINLTLGDPTDYCTLHDDMEARILEAVPCMRTAIETDKRLGIIDEMQVSITEAQLDEYLAMRNNPTPDPDEQRSILTPLKQK